MKVEASKLLISGELTEQVITAALRLVASYDDKNWMYNFILIVNFLKAKWLIILTENSTRGTISTIKLVHI